ncbi:hypothetical protein DINM_003345 [Dirofilaria immitis]|nr:hypothetical protein [Dirofilaria immitis]
MATVGEGVGHWIRRDSRVPGRGSILFCEIRDSTAGSFVNMTNHVAERISSNFTTYFILQFTLLQSQEGGEGYLMKIGPSANDLLVNSALKSGIARGWGSDDFVHAAPTTTPSVRITLSPSENVTNYYQ